MIRCPHIRIYVRDEEGRLRPDPTPCPYCQHKRAFDDQGVER